MYWAPPPSAPSSNHIGAGDFYTVPSPAENAQLLSNGDPDCSGYPTSVTVPEGDYYGLVLETGDVSCPKAPSIVYNARLDYPYYNIIYDGTLSSGTFLPYDNNNGVLSFNGGICAQKPEFETAVSTPGSSSPTSSCSDTVYSYYCSPSPVTYDCSGTYNGTNGLNYCLSSTSGKIVYSASCPSPGSGTISSVTAIPNSCFLAYNKTSPSNLESYLDSSNIFSYSGNLTSGISKQVDFLSSLASLLKSCQESNGNCTFTLTTQSSTPGELGIGNLKLHYNYNVSSLFNKSYNIFNITLHSTPIKPGSLVGYGATLQVVSQPFKTIEIGGFDSNYNCQIGIGNNLVTIPKNSSGICPADINLTTSSAFSFDGIASSKIYVFNKIAKPIIQIDHEAIQDKQKVSIPGQIQYLFVPITIKDNESSYDVNSAINVSILKNSINGFVFNNSFGYVSLTNGTYNYNLTYTGDEVTSKESIQQGNYVSWAKNLIKVEDIWNNTSPYNFTDLAKNYTFIKGSKIIDCQINGTNVTDTNECRITTLPDGTLVVTINYTGILKPNESLDPTIVAEVPPLTIYESAPSQTSSALNCYIPLGYSSCDSLSSLSPSFSQTAVITNNGTFTYPSINLSASIPQYNQVVPSSVLVEYNGKSVKPYYINVSSGVINWTTYNFSANSTEDWRIVYKGVPLRVELTNASSLGIFQWDVVLTAPPGLAYSNFYLYMGTPTATSQELCNSISTSSSPPICTTPNVQAQFPGNPNIYFIPGLSLTPPQYSVEVDVHTIPANGSIGFVPFANLGQAVQCSIVSFNQTPVVIGQVIETKDKVECTDPNPPSKQFFTLPFTYYFVLPSNAFSIVANSTVISPNGQQPLVSTGLSFIGNETYVPLFSYYNASGLPGSTKIFIVEFKTQPLSIIYKTYHPQTVYVNRPALSYINISLFNNAPIEILNASYNIPLPYGQDAVFVVNHTIVSNLSTVRGAYPISFTDVPGDSTDTGTIFYYTPSVVAQKLPSFVDYINGTEYIFSPFSLKSEDIYPINVSIFILNSTYDNLSSCFGVHSVYLANSVTAISGTPLHFECKGAGKYLYIYAGSFALDQSKLIIIQTNPLLNSPPPTVVSADPIVRFFVILGNDIVYLFKEIWNFISSHL